MIKTFTADEITDDMLDRKIDYIKEFVSKDELNQKLIELSGLKGLELLNALKEMLK